MTGRELSADVDVLIVEDDPTVRSGLRLLLEGWGYACVEAADGCQAVEAARSRPPRCVLLDLVMPGLDGFAVARTLRADPRTRGVHIHCVTGMSDPEARRRALDAGVEWFLTKPVEPAELLRALRGPAPAGQVGFVSGLNLAEAEELLDWLENQGCTALELTVTESGASVRCVCPTGYRLHVEGKAVSLVQG